MLGLPPERFVEKATELIPASVIKIAAYWRENGPEQTSTSFPKRTPFEPVQAAIKGRNDPCPCGSGKKFKKCCGQSR